MKNGSKVVLGTAVVGGLGYYLYQLAKTGKALETAIAFKIHSFSLVDATLQLDVTLINHGSVALNLRNIAVEAFYQPAVGDKVKIMTSRPFHQAVTVSPGQTTQFSLLLDTAKVADLVKKIGETNYKKLASSGLQVVAVTKALVNGFIPFSDESVQTVSIQNLAS